MERAVYSRHSNIINSSGTGKSQMVDQLVFESLVIWTKKKPQQNWTLTNFNWLLVTVMVGLTICRLPVTPSQANISTTKDQLEPVQTTIIISSAVGLFSSWQTVTNCGCRYTKLWFIVGFITMAKLATHCANMTVLLLVLLWLELVLFKKNTI